MRAPPSSPSTASPAGSARELREISHAAHAEVVAVLFLEQSQLEDFKRSGTTYRIAEALFEEMQIPIILGNSAFGGSRQRSAAELDEISLKGDNLPYTPKGHQQLAAEIARALAPTVLRRAGGGLLVDDWRALPRDP